MNSDKLQIKDIINMPNLDKLSEAELKKLLEPFIPAARKPCKAHAEDAAQKMIEQLSKFIGV